MKRNRGIRNSKVRKRDKESQRRRNKKVEQEIDGMGDRREPWRTGEFEGTRGIIVRIDSRGPYRNS